jgi:kynurenine---oxoglutarate transaminase / cysteine-S-conjugate beta-lyase / glutamine---phenylpyruvate transaminase
MDSTLRFRNASAWMPFWIFCCTSTMILRSACAWTIHAGFTSPSHAQRRLLTRTRSRPFHTSTATGSSSTTDNHSNAILSHRLDGLDKPTVWHEFSPLAVKHGSVNLGQGFPDWDPPAFAQRAMINSVDPAAGRHANQYARSYAHMPLATVLANDYTERFRLHRDGNGAPITIDPVTQVATAVGCTNALYCALQGLLNPGDEVILLEPAFDIYPSQVSMAGGVPVFVPLRPTPSAPPTKETSVKTREGASAYFQLDFDELEAAITDKTKVMLLNSPHNPTGKIFSKKELQTIADIVRKHPSITIISDEVYEHILFDENEPHISMATLLWDQTLTLSSSGKTFSCTGWKVGWAIGPARLVKAVSAVQQWVNFSAPTPNQDAIAQCLAIAREPYQGFPSFYDYLANDYKHKRHALIEALDSAGMTPIVPAGGFFIMADTSHIDFPYVETYMTQVTAAMPASPMPRDWALSRWLTETVGVTAIPPSAFYSRDNLHLARNLLRFAFCKNEKTIHEAQRRFEVYFGNKRE